MLQYDIIGDVHGHADKLEMLLQKLGYFRKDGVYRHLKNRKVIFLGDLIDRGPKIRETLHIAKDMCDAGNALIVMGNHEFNAISFHTPHTEKGGFFRNHEIDEIEQHIETLRAFRHFQSEWEMFLNWFKTIPLYLDLEALRCVHACWKPAHIKWLKKHYEGMTAKFLSITNNKRSKSRAYSVLNETLKGIEYKLPKPLSFVDKGGKTRTESRVKWWSADDKNRMGELLFNCPPEYQEATASENDNLYRYNDNVPVFFGHYWLQGNPLIDNSRAVCLDYSVAKGGKLAAYRFNEGEPIDNKNLCFV